MAEIHEVDGIREDRSTPPPVYFNILFYGLIIWAFFFCAYYLFSGWSSTAEFEKKMQAHQEKVTRAQQAQKTRPAGR